MKRSLHVWIGLSFLLTIAGILKVSGAATETLPDSLVIGYCNSEVSAEGIGYDQAGQLAVAVYFPEERMKKLIGSEITKIRYGLVKNRMASVTVFIKDELTGEPLYKQTTAKKPQKGWNEIVLDVPFPIDGKAIYIGFEYTQAAKSYSFSFTGSEKPYASFMAFNGNWLNCYGKGYGSLSLQCIVKGENLPEYDINLSQTETLPYVPNGEAFSIENEIGNFGTATIKGIDFTYQLNESEPVVIHKEINLPSGEYQTLTIDNLVGSDNQVSFIKVKITALDGKPDEDASDNERSVKIYSYGEFYPRNVLVEQFTTESCINCPKGTAFLKEVLQSYPNISWIAHHVGYGEDKYTAEASRDLLPFYGGDGLFAPAMMVNRTAFAPERYPVTGISTTAEYIQDVLNKATGVPAFVTVNVLASYEESTRKLDVEVAGDVLYLAGDDPRITIYLTEDSLYSTTQAGAKEYIHNHVLRTVLTGALGDSLIPDGNRYVFRKECEVPEKWKAGHLHVVAIISNYDKLNINNCKVLNMATVPLIEPVGIYSASVPENIQIKVEGKHVQVTGEYAFFEIYTLQGQRISNDNLAVGIYLVRVNDGSRTIVKKVIVR